MSGKKVLPGAGFRVNGRLVKYNGYVAVAVMPLRRLQHCNGGHGDAAQFQHAVHLAAGQIVNGEQLVGFFHVVLHGESFLHIPIDFRRVLCYGEVGQRSSMRRNVGFSGMDGLRNVSFIYICGFDP